jgi:hypothetical protein
MDLSEVAPAPAFLLLGGVDLAIPFLAGLAAGVNQRLVLGGLPFVAYSARADGCFSVCLS